LTEIRDAADNMPAVNAIKTLMDLDEQSQAHGRGVPTSPGLAIVIVDGTRGQSAPRPVVVDVEAEAESVPVPEPLPPFKPSR
jgi:hypothetical protein